jgi:hypothetical protein
MKTSELSLTELARLIAESPPDSAARKFFMRELDRRDREQTAQVQQLAPTLDPITGEVCR